MLCLPDNNIMMLTACNFVCYMLGPVMNIWKSLGALFTKTKTIYHRNVIDLYINHVKEHLKLS